MDGRGPTQALRKDGGLVKTAVAIGIHQPPDLSVVLLALRIIIHLDYKRPPVLIERQRDGIDHQRFGGNEFETKSLSELKSVHRILRSHRWEFREIVRIGDPLFSRAQRGRQAQENQRGRENQRGCQRRAATP